MSEHGGDHAVAAARAHGVQTMFTLSGGHVFPLYDGAVRAQPPMRILDVRHEQTAVFAAEATARLTRTPGLAVLTAGPGVTNGMSAITTAHFNGSPVVVLGGRAPDYRWGSGSLQEFDHPGCSARSPSGPGPSTPRPGSPAPWTSAFALAAARHRGPVFLDISLEALFGTAEVPSAPHALDRPRIAGAPAVPARRTRPTPAPSPRSPGCWPAPAGRCWSWAPTSGWTARPRRPAPRPRNCGCR